mmetsp:Transcript_19194/g.53477  ORF Transcript_19194/g.53477 Transcript_19194/m.53477 type:complete len:344 (+) Transcript_19194:537-1568(+)|eukprot:CAMPEP_0172356344 /NCGR_PEP_ID=MMETSP1060-20121228/695_1 /TAXON_ID=37318 /ORGANISM="Pseudo-nitzschia pungens, Strain cf. cingulata" /LENGTH=343 /DNA_ID=CAMNT_0013076385 /DNA_START=493 /DNA_END=1524 /DNA_ORIENTATION=-
MLNRSTTIVGLLTVWFLGCVSNIGSVSATSTIQRQSNPFGIYYSSVIRSKLHSSELSFLTSRALLNTRGGADDSDSEEFSEDEDSYDEEDESEDDEDLFDGFDLDEHSSDDFKEDNKLDQIIEEYHRTPPITKAYLTASFVVTALGYVMTNNEFPPLLSLDWNKVFKGGQIWRPFTAFLNLGSLGLIGYPMTIHFVHQYMSFLERLSHNKPYEFWIMILFGMTSMLVGYPIMKMSPRFLGHNLSTFLVYIWSRMFEGVDVGVFEFIHIKAELLPWFLLAQTFLLEGEPPTLDFLGIVFGHVYYHFRKVGMLRAPDWLIKWYDESPKAELLRKKYKTISSDFGV